MTELKPRPGDSKAKEKIKNGSYKDVYSNNIDGGVGGDNC